MPRILKWHCFLPAFCISREESPNSSNILCPTIAHNASVFFLFIYPAITLNSLKLANYLNLI